ncbi:MAG: hypothetical protein PHU06_10120 [Gallionella sp.]|nr:hypothetical protein [Gallionella sp.]MDD4958901.1 hypothetical protein [Gallionella sp.]
MSSIKDYLFDLQNERADEWIRQRLQNEDSDEHSDEWNVLAQEYHDYQEHLFEEAEHQAELKWLRENGSSQIHKFFMDELAALEGITQRNLENRGGMLFMPNSQLITKMAFAYSVTLLEAFLGDTLKSLITENDKFLENAIANVDEVKKAKYSLSDLQGSGTDVKSLTVRKISEILFHNIPKVKVVYEQVLGKSLSIDISKVNKISEIRHHVVHRNGRTLDGEHIVVTAEDLYNAILCIKEFSSDLQAQINGEMKA